MIEPVKITVGSTVMLGSSQFVIRYISKDLLVMRGEYGGDEVIYHEDFDSIKIPSEIVVPE